MKVFFTEGQKDVGHPTYLSSLRFDEDPRYCYCRVAALRRPRFFGQKRKNLSCQRPSLSFVFQERRNMGKVLLRGCVPGFEGVWVMWYNQRMTTGGKAWTFFILLLMLTLVATGCTAGGSPRRSLSELRTALVNHDADAALRYVDVDSIVEGMVKDLFLEYEVKASDDPMAALGLKAGKRVADAMMPAVREMARHQVRMAITSDDQWGYFKEIRKASVWYLNIREDGDTAIVEPKGKSDFRFRMTKTTEGRWRIVEIMRKKGSDTRSG
jgi:hypothetical protein